eukprot:g9451.t1
MSRRANSGDDLRAPAFDSYPSLNAPLGYDSRGAPVPVPIDPATHQPIVAGDMQGVSRLPMSLVLGDKLLQKTNQDHFPHSTQEVSTEKELADAELVVVYFSAHWCPPCRGFTPLLIEKHKRAERMRKSVKFVFVSLDKSQDQFNEYCGLMPWYAVPYNAAKQRSQVLMQQLGIRGIPAVVLYWKNQAMPDTNGREKLMSPDFFLNHVPMADAAPRPLPGGLLAMGGSVGGAGGHSTSTIGLFGGATASGLASASSTSAGVTVTSGSAISALRQTETIEATVVLPDGSENQELEIELDPTATELMAKETFQFQLYSVTNIEPEAQRVFVDGMENVDPGLHQFSKFFTDLWREFGPGGGSSSSGSGPAAAATSAGTMATDVSWTNIPVPGSGSTASTPSKKKLKIYVLGNMSGEADDPFRFQARSDQSGRSAQQRKDAENFTKAKAAGASHNWQRIYGDALKVRNYEDRELQTACLMHIPVPRLFEAAKARVAEAGQSFDYAFLDVLVKWFKSEFMSWPADSPASVHAENSKCSMVRNSASTEYEQIFGSHSAHVYRCEKTGKEQRFPRYNNVFKLLETRCGRCGEWANVFSAMLRAVGYETRFIADTTDHVWCEAFLPSKEETGEVGWVHVDSCEATVDAPLLYEAGWGKDLQYIFGYARDHCLDVTKRYTKKPLSLLQRNIYPSEQEVKNVFTICMEPDQRWRFAPGGSERHNAITTNGHSPFKWQRITYHLLTLTPHLPSGPTIICRLHVEECDLDVCVPERTPEADQDRECRRRLLETRREREQKFLDDCVVEYNKGEVDQKNLNARESGDVEWRRQRGDLGRTNFGKSHADTKSFQDEEQEKEVEKVVVWDGQFCHGLQLIFRDIPVSKHPPRWSGESKDCSRKEIVLQPGEKITKVCGRAGDIIDHLEIATDKGQTVTAGSSTGGAYFCSDSGADVCGLYGGYGGHLHNIGFIYRKAAVGGGAGAGGCSSSGGTTSAAAASSGGVENEAAAPSNNTSSATSTSDNKPGNVVCVDGVCRFEPKERVAPAAAAPAPASPPTTEESKAAMQARIKVLFDQYVKDGKAPNEAAALALRDVGRERQDK